MKWMLTVIAMGQVSRRRQGKARTAVIESQQTTPLGVEREYERAWNELNTVVKVIDVRPAGD